MAEDRPAGSEDEELEATAPLDDSEEIREGISGVQDAAETRDRDTEKFFVVGIGASAGGLEALSELVKHAPLDKMALVVVQHLAPHHDSILPQLLARSTTVEVLTAADGMPAQPNHVYVIPPNTDLALLHGTLRLIPPPTDGRPRLPIDYFFRSLAQDKGHAAIGVILSGTGTDGTLGLGAIKEGGGLGFVQDPPTARYDGMPRSALQSGFADFCLAPRAIGEELARIARQSDGMRIRRAPVRPPQVQEQIARLFLLVRSAFGNDLTRYKPTTVERRIERRMTLHRMGNLEEYVKYVQGNPEELHALYRDMLIAVTNFFRDHEPFEQLKSKIFPRILEDKGSRLPIRIWVPACATGEEAYSIAIVLLESLGEKAIDLRVQIFGTDVDDQSIQHARRGIYPHNIELDVSPDRLSRFFIRRDSDYQVSRRIRDMVVFSKQNLLRDAPFSRMDLVSCRNVLIYLQPSAQKKVLNILHYALNPSGYLLLGNSETVGDAPELFSLLDRKTKIYTKRHSGTVSSLDEILSVPAGFDRVRPGAAARPAASLQVLADRKIIEVYGPPGVLINENLDILHFRGHTGPYLNPAPGAASFNLLRLARPELHIELKRCVQEAFSDDKRVSTDVKFYDTGRASAVRLDLVPFHEPETNTRCLLVSFIRLDPPPDVLPAAFPVNETDDRIVALGRRLQEVERELEATKEYLQSTIEDKESANEELKSANEELQSSNEELQSTNEELETSREEMQSSNEELTTVNEELQNRMSELGQTNDDLHNVLVGLDNTVIIVGLDLRIRRFTATAERLLDLVAGDVGRTIGYLDTFCGVEMGSKVSHVIESLASVEEELLCRNQRWYLLRIAPYKTLDHSIRGAVISLSDIDIRKRSAALMRDVGEYASKFLGAIHHPLVMLDGKFRIVWANDAYYKRFQMVPEETIGNVFPNMGDPAWTRSRVRDRLEDTLRTGTVLKDFTIPTEGKRVRLGASRVPVASDSTLLLISIEEA
jgi:two-component system CheB/CheR fusion protein